MKNNPSDHRKFPELRAKEAEQDLVSWYLPEVSKSMRNPTGENDHFEKPNRTRHMIQKLNLGTAVAALILFFLPWIDIQCSDKSLATQTGIQMIYGGGSVSADMESFSEGKQMKTESKTSDESMGYAPLVGLALIAVIGAVVVSFVALRSAEEPERNLVGLLCAIALGLLAVQMMIGFPVKKKLGESMAEASGKTDPSDPMSGMGQGMAAAMMMNFQVKHLPALYIELVMLGLPTLVLANGMIDRMKKAERQLPQCR